MSNLPLISGIASRVKLIVDLIPHLTECIGNIVHNLVVLIEASRQYINSLAHQVTRLYYSTWRIAQRDVPSVCRLANLYFNSVQKVLSYYGEYNRKRVVEALMQQNMQPLKEFIGLLNHSLSHTTSCYAKFKEAVDKVMEDCASSAEACEHGAINAKSKKRATKVIGGGLSAAAIAGGIGGGVALGGAAASVVAGFFTFGIGTAVGLGLTAAATATVGAGLGIAGSATTHKVATDFKNDKKKFLIVCDIFKSICSSMSSCSGAITIIQSKLEAVDKVIQDIEYCQMNQHSIPTIAHVVILLFETLSASSAKLSVPMQQFESARAKLDK